MTKRYDTSKQWYAIHTYSGYEEKVAESIRQRAESLDMKDKIFQVLVPKEKMIEVKYVGFEIDNEFVVGYGLDYDGLGRNLEDIYQAVQ